ncbi:hypothetical protein [Phaffia rhodozyma]|uniref:Uncharacterized protein n=1 Tax=Phaffia rhodozyma TaxID=264483 RepID=A0A0F7SJB3_PHARH|nr:hypothetical protein [Phaffia rhodozyma]
MLLKAIGRPIRLSLVGKAYSVLPSLSTLTSGTLQDPKSSVLHVGSKSQASKKVYYKIGDKDVSRLNSYQLYTLYNPIKDSKIQFVDELSFGFTKHASNAKSSNFDRDALVETLSHQIETNSSALSPLQLSSSLTKKYSDSILNLSLTATRRINKLWSVESKCWVPLSPPDDLYHRMDKFVIGVVTASDLINGLNKDKRCLQKAVEELKAHWINQRDLVESDSSLSDKQLDSSNGQPIVVICLVGWGPAKLKMKADNQIAEAMDLETEILKTSIQEGCLISEAMNPKDAYDLIWSMLGDFARKVQVDNERQSFIHTDPDLVVPKGKSQEKAYSLMLQQIPSISAANVKAITSAYPTLRVLMEALSTEAGFEVPKFPSEKAALIRRALTTEDPNSIIDAPKSKVQVA